MLTHVMSSEGRLPKQNSITLAFEDAVLEKEFRTSYDKSVRLPLRQGIIISILSWFSALGLIFAIIPEQMSTLGVTTIVYIGSVFGFIVYTTYSERFKGYYHLLGAFSNAWAGMFVIYFCAKFPNGVNLILPALIFIIFFGSYMIRLRWIAGFFAALTYTLAYHIYIAEFSDLPSSQVILYAFVGWMTLIFAILAGRASEGNHRVAFIQQKTIREQQTIIEKEKEALLKEVHHRVKNNLQIIVSLINLQLANFDDEGIEVALKETQSRILSMSLVHQRMHQTSNFSEIAFDEYAQQLIDNLTYLFNAKRGEFKLNIPEEFTIDIETAIPMGLILNEIGSNFFKHCIVEGSTGKILSIDVELSGSGDYVLTCSDNGDGFPEGTNIEKSNSLGLELISSLVEQIEGDFKFYNDNGAVYEIRGKA